MLLLLKSGIQCRPQTNDERLTCSQHLVFVWYLFVSMHLCVCVEHQDIINLQYLSFIYYAWCALMINEFKDIDVLFNPKYVPRTLSDCLSCT